MIFGERNNQRQKKKELREEIRQMRKQLLAAGCDKGNVNELLKEFEAALELGERLKTDYEDSRHHLEQAMKLIERLLTYMGEASAEEIKKELQELVQELELVYHDCSIRRDDADFASTLQCLKGAAAEFGSDTARVSAIMLRSELENIQAVLREAGEWSAPDFFALGYYVLHEDRTALGEMENGQRNDCVADYLKEHFSERFAAELRRAGADDAAARLKERYFCG